MSPSAQPRVPAEAISWCITQTAIDAWERRGQVLQKAHRIREKPTSYGSIHSPLCGASAVEHFEARCAEAPRDWPACRKCAKKPVPFTLPEVFYR